MKYIPGFSNYLRTSVPRYARGGPARYAGEDVYVEEQPYEQSYFAPAEQPYVNPHQYLPATEQPYVDPYQYQEPVYQEPVYQEPVYQEPVYAAPAYVDPYQYQQPSYMPAAEQPYTEPVYQEPVYTPPVYQNTTPLGDIPQYTVEDYGIIGGLADQYTAPRISEAQVEADRLAVAQMEAERYAAAQAEAQRVADAQAAEQARAQAAQQAAEQAAAQQAEAQRVAAQQAAEQAAAQQAAAQQAEAQRVAAQQAEAQQAEAQRVAAQQAAAAEQARAQAEAAAQAQAAEQARIQAEAQAAEQARAQAAQQAEAATQAEAQRVAARQAAPVYQEPAYTPPVDYTAALENLQSQYDPPVYQEPAYTPPVYNEPATYDMDRFVDPYQYQQPMYSEPAYMPAAEQPYVAPVEQPFAAPYAPVAEQPYVSPIEQPYAEPYVAPQAERAFASPRYNSEDIYMSAPAETPYVPGFTNYLEASIPPYVAPAEAAAPYVEPYQPAPAAQPMTQEAAPAEVPFDINSLAGLDFSGLNNLYGMNFGTDFGGGAMGGQYEADPNLQYISAPLSNKGNATSQTGGNTFAVRVDQPVRLVDHRTNQIVFEGTGFDAARKATELGQGLTDEFGRKANYSIQTADPTGNYSTVAYEKKNKSTLGKIAGAVGTALPLATMFIPGLNVLGTIAAGAGLGGAGAALRGDDILKGVAMGGLSAAGGQVLGPALEAGGKFGTALAPKLATAVGTGIGSTAGGLVTGQDLKSSLLSGVASGALSYVAPTIANELGIKPINLNGTKGTSGSSGMTADGGLQVTASTLGTPSVGYTLGGSSPSKLKLPETTGPETPYDGITAIGNRLGNVNLSVNQFGTSGQDQSAFERLTQPEPAPEMPVEDIIKVTGQVPGAVTPYAPIAGFEGAGLSPEVINKIDQPAADTPTEEEILVQARKGFDPVSITAPLPIDFLPTGALPTAAPTETVSPEEILVEARKPLPPTSPGLSPEILRAVEGPATDKPATDEIVVTGQRPSAVTAYAPIAGIETPMPKTPEADAKDRKLGVEEYLRLLSLVAGLADAGGGKGSAGKYTPGGRLGSIFSAKLPSAGGLGAIGGNRTLRSMGDVDWLTYGTRPELSFYDYANPAPLTRPIPNEPRGPSMYAPETDDNTFARGGGAFAAKRGGPSQRTEFAVNGPGTGRSDDIPAVLSDGEYVIDAETVALLGDGSSKAGAKKLDELRVKVRKHKGQKLAKGRFSANAKKPEAYLSGGRV
jgi:hypothetical protein